MSEAELRVPFAIDAAGAIVEPTATALAEPLRCPASDCGGRLIHRAPASAYFRPHFAHLPDATCNPETLDHRLAKAIIVAAFARRGAMLVRTCPEGHGTSTPLLAAFGIHAEEEVPSGRWRVDVGLFWEGRPFAGIEVCATHPVDDDKRRGLPVPFVEVAAAQVLECRGQDLLFLLVLSANREGCAACRRTPLAADFVSRWALLWFLVGNAWEEAWTQAWGCVGRAIRRADAEAGWVHARFHARSSASDRQPWGNRAPFADRWAAVWCCIDGAIRGSAWKAAQDALPTRIFVGDVLIYPPPKTIP